MVKLKSNLSTAYAPVVIWLIQLRKIKMKINES